MRRFIIVSGLAALSLAAGLITSAPQASAGCWYGGPFISKCDGPIQPDGTWQRCVGMANYIPGGLSGHLVPVKRCDFMGPGQPAWDAAFADPPTHIND